ncbi:cell wall metabolism sensor histidine kinase WalK [Oscillospiraceae bacterium HV4-5-C5C]|nr:cell wall metabolism sensor histidine kinase WalK [Oscillospiraceae bacterium HV4-5-C5C]
MRHQVFLKRIMALMVIAITLSAALTLFFYYFITSDVIYSDMARRDFLQKGSLLADQSESYLLKQLSEGEYNAAVSMSSNMLSAPIAIQFYDDKQMVQFSLPQGTDLDDSAIEQARTLIENSRSEIEKQNTVYIRIKLGQNHVDAIIVGYPIEVFDSNSGSRDIRGAVYIVKSMDYIRTGYDSLNFALVFASCIAVILMLLPTYIAISRLIRPLNQVRNVATAMSNGNFTLRADSSQPGEIGELGQAINDLAADLDRSISALMKERNRLRQILDNLSEGIIAVNPELIVTHANPAVGRLLGFPSTELPDEAQDPTSEQNDSQDDNESNRSLSVLLQLKSGQDLLDDFRKAIRQQKTVTRSFQNEDRILYFQVAPLLDEDQKVIGAVALLRDVTAAEKLEQTRRDYIANVSHELRTPLTALRGLIEPLADGLVTEESDRLRYYSIIQNETLRLSRLIDDMLELSRLQAGKISLKRSQFNIWDILREVEAKYQAVAEEKGLTFALPPYRADTPLVYSNPDRIEQVLVILLDNAMKYTDAGGIIEIQLSSESDKLILAVKDTGKGISADDQQHVFERFYKADRSRGRSGTGLGLSIAKEMLNILGERIWVRSYLGHGSTFYFSISKLQSGRYLPGSSEQGGQGARNSVD